MPEQKRQHERQNDQPQLANDKSVAAQSKAAQQASAGPVHDLNKEFAQLGAKIVDRQQQAIAMHENQQQELNERQSRQSQELKDAHAAERPETTAGRSQNPSAVVDLLNDYVEAKPWMLLARKAVVRMTDAEKLKRNLVDVAEYKEKQEAEIAHAAENAEQILAQRENANKEWYGKTVEEIERNARKRFPSTKAAFEGLEIEI